MDKAVNDEILLEVCSLHYSYQKRLAVDGASFEIRRGEIFGLVGPNGAGKTTTISCVSGLLAAWRGEMRFCGIMLFANCCRPVPSPSSTTPIA